MKAIDSLQKVIESNPNDAKFWSSLSDIYKTVALYKEAIDSLQKAIELYPNEVLYWTELADIYEKAMIYADKSVETLLQALKLDFNNDEDINYIRTQLEYLYSQRGFNLARFGQYNEAINYFLKAIELNPNSGAWKSLGYVYDANGQYKEAKECFQKAVELDPNDFESRNMLDKLNNI